MTVRHQIGSETHGLRSRDGERKTSNAPPSASIDSAKDPWTRPVARHCVNQIHTRLLAAICLALAFTSHLLSLPAAAAGSDSGSYILYSAGRRIGEEQFAFSKIEQARRLTTATTFKLGSRVVDQQVTLDLDAQDRPLRVQAKDARGTTSATFDDNQIEISGSKKDERSWPQGYLLRYPSPFITSP